MPYQFYLKIEKENFSEQKIKLGMIEVEEDSGEDIKREDGTKEEEFAWVDVFHYTSVNNRTEAELIQFDNQGEFVDILPEPFHGSFDTIVLYETVVIVSSPYLQQLLSEVEKYNIRRLIFNKCRFSENVDDICLPSCVREVVFNNCGNLQELISNFLSVQEGKKYGLRRLVLKGVSYIIPLLGLIYFHLSSKNNYIRRLKFINSKPAGEVYYRDINYYNWLEKVLKRNEKGYMNCKEVCINILAIKKYRLSPLVKSLDSNVVRLVTSIIWKTRYSDDWHDKANKK